MSLHKKYNTEIKTKMKDKFGYKNLLEAPVLEKVAINVGLGRMSQQSSFSDKLLPEIIKDLASITGQKPAETRAKKSIAGFKMRQGQIVGLKVTLRKKKMFDFMDKLINVVLPRVRDFRGINLKNIDKKGNLSLGFKENVVFPEINTETQKIDFGLEVTMVVRAENREEAIELYRQMGLPLKK